MILELLLEAAVWTQHLLLITSHHPAKKLNQIQIWPTYLLPWSMVSPRCFLKARNHRFIDRSYTRKRLTVNAKDPRPVFHEMISERDCRRQWAHPPLGRALHKPQQFGKKVREERTCSDAPQAAGFAGSHPTLLASKNSEKLKCDNKGTLRSCTPGSQSSSHRQPGVPGVQ